MPTEPDKRLTQADRTVVWIDKALVKLAKEIAAREDGTISEVVERLLKSKLVRLHTRLFIPAETGDPGS